MPDIPQSIVGAVGLYSNPYTIPTNHPNQNTVYKPSEALEEKNIKIDDDIPGDIFLGGGELICLDSWEDSTNSGSSVNFPF